MFGGGFYLIHGRHLDFFIPYQLVLASRFDGTVAVVHVDAEAAGEESAGFRLCHLNFIGIQHLADPVRRAAADVQGKVLVAHRPDQGASCNGGHQGFPFGPHLHKRFDKHGNTGGGILFRLVHAGHGYRLGQQQVDHAANTGFFAVERQPHAGAQIGLQQQGLGGAGLKSAGRYMVSFVMPPSVFRSYMILSTTFRCRLWWISSAH